MTRDTQTQPPLTDRQCRPCSGETAPLAGDSLASLAAQLEAGWRLVDEHHLEREFEFDDFRQALDFTTRLGELAESEGHHPDLELSYGRVVLKLWTHKIGGLSENDFILAAKIDRLPRP